MLKNIIHKFLLIATLAFSFNSFLYAGDFCVEDQPQVLEQVLQITPKGTLKQKDNGYLYVEVAGDFIAQALALIDAPGKLVPPRHYTSKKGIGAHISVMYENEQIENEIWEIAELGQEYTFNVIELRTVKINSNNKMKKLWLIAVSCPALEQLREKYGLKPLLKGHDFHITVCSQIPGKPEIIEMPVVVEELKEAA
jgi:hypothetical protein